MRVLINYATYANKVSIHCLADDTRTVVASYKRVSTLETLYRLIKYVGGDPEQCRREIKDWGHGGCWADVKPEHYELLGIKKMAAVARPEVGQIGRRLMAERKGMLALRQERATH